MYRLWPMKLETLQDALERFVFEDKVGSTRSGVHAHVHYAKLDCSQGRERANSLSVIERSESPSRVPSEPPIGGIDVHA